MSRSLQELSAVLNRTVIPHDVEFYRRQEREMHARLLDQQRQGWAVKADDAGSDGKILGEILDQLLEHPLCQSIPHKPELYIHYDPASQFVSFSNAIIVPYYEISGMAEDNGRQSAGVKACIAHELGHIISRDCDPSQRARNPHVNMNQRMERRADLIAAHLCGDGGKSLADHFQSRLPLERLTKQILLEQSSWVDKFIGQVAVGLDRKYPKMEDRVKYLNGWAAKFQQDRKLPDVSSLENNYPSRD